MNARVLIMRFKIVSFSEGRKSQGIVPTYDQYFRHRKIRAFTLLPLGKMRSEIRESKIYLPPENRKDQGVQVYFLFALLTFLSCFMLPKMINTYLLPLLLTSEEYQQLNAEDAVY